MTPRERAEVISDQVWEEGGTLWEMCRNQHAILATEPPEVSEAMTALSDERMALLHEMAIGMLMDQAKEEDVERRANRETQTCEPT